MQIRRIFMALRKKHIDFIDQLREKTGLSLSALAKSAGLSDSTLTRFFIKPEFKRLSTASLDKLSKVAGFESYEDYLLETHQTDDNYEHKVEINDATKFSVYESVKVLLSKKLGSAKPSTISDVSQEVILYAQKLKTDFISDSLIMYVIESMERDNKLL